MIDLDFYDLPLVDFGIEAVLVVACALLYTRTYAPERWQRRWVAAAAVALVLVQGVLDYGLRHQPWRQWDPSLAQARWQPHLTVATSGNAVPPLRMALALTASTHTARSRWRRTDPEAW